MSLTSFRFTGRQTQNSLKLDGGRQMLAGDEHGRTRTRAEQHSRNQNRDWMNTKITRSTKRFKPPQKGSRGTKIG